MTSPPHEPTQVDELLATFRSFGQDIASVGSPIYARLCAALADDPQRASVVLAAAPAFRTPLILLAAVHHLLLSGADEDLARYYPTVAGEQAWAIDDDLVPAFAAFVDRHRSEVERLVATHSTQTNEARRTVLTLPALGMVSAESGRPLALLEVGASAGLNLLADRYGYRIGPAAAGDLSSSVQLECAVEGELMPPVPAGLEIAWRLGVDLHPLDVRDPETRAWLRALVWPEHRDRMELLDAALEIARHDPPPLVRGDLAKDLPRFGGDAPDDAELVVLSTWVLAYVSDELRVSFLDSMRQMSSTTGRDVWFVACEAQSVVATMDLGLAEPPPRGYGPSMLILTRFSTDGRSSHRLLAECQPHGRWIRWLDAASAVDSAPPA